MKAQRYKKNVKVESELKRGFFLKHLETFIIMNNQKSARKKNHDNTYCIIQLMESWIQGCQKFEFEWK